MKGMAIVAMVILFSVVVMAGLLLPLSLSLSLYVKAVLDNQSFQHCWNKTLAEMGVPSSLFEPLKHKTEQEVLKGNITSTGVNGTPVSDGFRHAIYDCMTK
jgi:hypothetical protein